MASRAADRGPGKPSDKLLTPRSVTVALAGKTHIFHEPRVSKAREIVGDLADHNVRFRHLYDAKGVPRNDAPPGDMVRGDANIRRIVCRALGLDEADAEHAEDYATSREMADALNAILKLAADPIQAAADQMGMRVAAVEQPKKPRTRKQQTRKSRAK